ncbi:hypothetical protein B0H63DRAFT_525383 [Podospora didyma]|uniref:Uncharacterized protein n=1 Tax=Podospora didyma TaxID=330526 RepID=A0AAE0ND00_9PEZI|nr:hypothetical protein B0H63DRAFT_525383 [Podospora didyma]
MQPSPEAEDAVFGPFGAWLLNDILSDEEGRRAMSSDLPKGAAGVTSAQIEEQIIANPAQSKSMGMFRPMQRPIAFVVDALLGVFKAEEVFLPRGSSKNEPKGYRLAACPAVRGTKDSDSVGACLRGSISAVFDKIFWGSGRPNCIDEPQVDPEFDELLAPPQLKFFEWFMRHYLDLRFADDAFQVDYDLESGLIRYHEVMRSFGIFSLDDVERRRGGADHASDIYVADFSDGAEIPATTTGPAPTLRYFRRGIDDSWPGTDEPNEPLGYTPLAAGTGSPTTTTVTGTEDARPHYDGDLARA